ncbi:MAG: AAA family ATPase [Gammaproteobacteria bacterium]|nr:MAG: AAA family ATPase [Gammaproteobacteria bacterium]
MRKYRRRKSFSVSTNKTDYVPKCLQGKIDLWTYRIIFKLGGHREFIDNGNRFDDDSLAYYLGLGKFVDSNDEFKRNDVLEQMRVDYDKIDGKKQLSTNKTIQKNISRLSSLMNFNEYECQVLEFVIILQQTQMLESATDLLGRELNLTQVKKSLSVILKIPPRAIDKMFSQNSKFIQSSIVNLEREDRNSLERKISPLNDRFSEKMANNDEDIEHLLTDFIRPVSKSDLELKDYNHIKKDIDLLLPYLQKSLNKSGVNIMLYGPPGTGKTQLAKVVAEHFKTKLFEISYADLNDDPISGSDRLKSYKMAQTIMKTKNALLLYDEAEDVFDTGNTFFKTSAKQKNKAWINRTLESNPVPTIWISNNIYGADQAVIRRFDLSINMPVPDKKQRRKIIIKNCDDKLDAKTLKKLSSHAHLSPAVINTAAKVAKSLPKANMNKNILRLVNNTLQAQGLQKVQKKIKNLTDKLPKNYDTKFLNTSANLNQLVAGIRKTCDARLCLYGVAGTGKSAYGRYIAQTLKKKVILKKASDLQSKWLGECEQNIAAAFADAKKKKAVLIFDEADTFLQDRNRAKAQWNLSQTNEMLVQMENFKGIFIATTNLLETLDKASLRRFDLKLEFKYLNTKQSWDIFRSFACELKIKDVSNSLKKRVEDLKYLTPGDFAAIIRQNRFKPVEKATDLIDRLEEEIAVKGENTNKKIGF